MNRLAVAIGVALLATTPVVLVNAQQSLRVPPDTVLEIRLSRPVSTKTAQAGDVVEGTLVRLILPPAAPAIELPLGSRVVGGVDLARKGEPRKTTARLRLSFTTAGGGTTPSYAMTSRVLTITGRHQIEGADHDIVVRVLPRSEFGEPAIFGVPFGAGMGLLIGRSGKTAILGASTAFLWMYLPPLFRSTNNPWADVELKRGDTLALHTTR